MGYARRVAFERVVMPLALSQIKTSCGFVYDPIHPSSVRKLVYFAFKDLENNSVFQFFAFSRMRQSQFIENVPSEDFDRVIFVPQAVPQLNEIFLVFLRVDLVAPNGFTQRIALLNEMVDLAIAERNHAGDKRDHSVFRQ